MTLLCVLILLSQSAASLATAHGSFTIDNWKVWNNGTIFANSHIETALVPVRVDLPSRQTLWIGAHTSLRIDGPRISVERGCAQLSEKGPYSLNGSESGLLAGSSPDELSRAAQIPFIYRSLQELRPMSQRP